MELISPIHVYKTDGREGEGRVVQKSLIFFSRERFVDHPLPPPINFVHDHLFFSKIIIIYFSLLRQFLGRALRLGRATGPSAAARKDYNSTIFNKISVYLG